MRALVTGGVGFVGTNLIKRLLKDGHDVTSLDNYSTGFKENEQEGCKYVNIDIRDNFDDYVSDIDVIFHLAALPRIKPSFENPKEVCDINVGGTHNILDYAKNHKIPMIYAGSSSFWGGTYKNPYTFSKWQGEELCKLYERIYGLSITICRFYNVYGDNMPESGSYRTVLPIFLEQYKNGEPLTITGQGNQRRDFTHVDDIIGAMMRIVQLNKWGSTFELGRGKNYSIKELVLMISKFTDGKVSWTHIPEIRGEMKETLCKSELARKKLRWEPKINLNEWLEDKLCE